MDEKTPLSLFAHAVGVDPVFTAAKLDLPAEFSGVPLMVFEVRKGWRFTYEPPEGSQCSSCGALTLARNDAGDSFCKACRESAQRAFAVTTASQVPNEGSNGEQGAESV